LKYYIDYPIFENSNLDKTIHKFFKQKIQSLNNVYEIHATFEEFLGENIKSIVYNIYEDL
jgi:hypothetical protein